MSEFPALSQHSSSGAWQRLFARPARRLRHWFASTGAYIADLMLPPICIACHEPVGNHGLLCPSCWSSVEFIRPPVCERLGTPLPFDMAGANISAAALANPPIFNRARAAAVYSGVMRTLIHAFKYHDRHEGARFFSRLMQQAGMPLLRECDVIVPVPLSRARLIERRFNQSAILARHVARLSHVPSEPLALIRTRHTPQQVGLTLEARRANVDGAFAVPPRWRARLRGARVLLVDDVMTTGATANACARTLLSAGAASVDVLTLARVIEPGS